MRAGYNPTFSKIESNSMKRIFQLGALALLPAGTNLYAPPPPTGTADEEIYTMANAALITGQKFFRVHVFPFKMSDDNMIKHKGSKWIDFWKNLKQGHDYFENNNHNPPNVLVKNKTYIFE